MKRKIYTLMFLYFVFTATNVFCDKNQSAAITKAADHGGDLSSCSPQALQAAADYASSKGFDAAAAAIISELTSRYGPAYKEAIEAESAAADAIRELVKNEKELKEALDRLENLNEKLRLSDDVATRSEYKKAVRDVKRLSKERGQIQKDVQKKAEAMEQAYKKLAEICETLQIAGDPVFISSGKYQAEYTDFEAQDFGEKFSVKRKLSNKSYDEGFGHNWNSPFASRIIRCIPDFMDSMIMTVNESLNYVHEGLDICKNYKERYPDFICTKIEDYITEYTELKNNYSALLELLNEKNRELHTIFDFDKRVAYGRFSDPETYKGSEYSIIYVDENGFEYVCYLNERGEWESLGDLSKDDFVINSIDSNENITNGRFVGNGYVVSYKNGQKNYYDEYGVLSKKVDINGNVTRFYSDNTGRIKAVVLKTGEQLNIVLNDKFQITEIEGPVSGKAVFYYENDCLLKVIGTDGIEVRFKYDEDFDLTKIIKADDSYVSINYGVDKTNRKVCTHITNENSFTEYFEYDPQEKEVIHKTVNGNVELFRYNDFGNVVYRKNEDGKEYILTNNALGLITSQKNPDGDYRYIYDDKNNLVMRIENNDGVARFEYDEEGRLLKAFDEDGFYNEYIYDDRGNVIAHYYCSNLITACEYSDNGLLIHASENNCDYYYDYNNFGSITSKTTIDHNVHNEENIISEKWVYDDTNRLCQYINASGEITDFIYDKNYKCEISPEKLKKEHFYNSRGWEYKLVETDLNTGIKYVKESAFDNQGRCVEVKIDGQLFSTYDYLPSGVLKEYTVWNINNSAKYNETKHGIKTEYKYDSFGRILSESKTLVSENSEGRIPILDECSITYTNKYISGNNSTVVSQIKDCELPYVYTYDKKGRLTSFAKPDGYERKIAYSKGNRKIYETDSNGYHNKYTYNNDGTYSVRTELNNVFSSECEYNEADLLISYSDFTGSFKKYNYNGFGLPVEESANDTITEFYYNKKNKLCKKNTIIKDSNKKNVISKNYSDNVITTRNGRYISSVKTYDAWGRVTELTDSNGKTKYEYNCLGQIQKSINGNGEETEYLYNALGLISKAIKENEITEYVYGVDGRIVAVYKNGKKCSEYEYNKYSQLISHTNFLGDVKQFSYNQDGNINSIVNNDTGCAKFSYTNDSIFYTNENGYTREKRRIQLKAGNSLSTIVEKNFLNQIEFLKNENTQLKYEYDETFRLIRQKDEKSGIEIDYFYDDFGRLDGKKSEIFDVDYIYDECGKIKRISENKSKSWVNIKDSKNKIEYEYSTGERLIQFFNNIGQLQGEVIKDRLGQVQYYEAVIFNENNKIAMTYNNEGNFSRFKYDSRGRLVYEEKNYRQSLYEAELAELISCGGFEPAANIALPKMNLSDNEYYEINNICRLMDVKFNPVDLKEVWTIEYDYTLTGSLKQKKSPLGTIVYEYDEKDRPVKKHTTETNDFGITYCWNDSDTLELEQSQYYTKKYEFDSNNKRPVRIKKTDYQNQTEELIEYDYDALGRRYCEKINGLSFIYIYDGVTTNVIGKIPVFENGRINVYSIDEMNYSNEYRTFIDIQNNNTTRSVENTYRKVSYSDKPVINIGVVAQNYYSLDLADNTIKVANMLNWSNNNSVWGNNSNLGFRDYDASIKCFTSSDPVSDGGNYFAYCATDPLNYRDSAGFKKTSITPAQEARFIAALAYFLTFNPQDFAEGGWGGMPKSFDCADTSAFLNWVASKTAGIDNISPLLQKFGELLDAGKIEEARAIFNSKDFFSEDFEESFTKLFRGYDRNLLRNLGLSDEDIYKQNEIYKDVTNWIMTCPGLLGPGTVLVWKSSKYPAGMDSGNWTGHTLTVLARCFDDNGNLIGFAYLEGHQGEDHLTEIGYMSLQPDNLGRYDLDSWYGDFLGAYEIESSDKHWESLIKNNNCSK